MTEVISNTSPLLYLYRIGVLDWLPQLFTDIWTPRAVIDELHEGRAKGYEVPDHGCYPWLQIVEPRFVPSEWLTLDLGAGELAALALGLENPTRILLLDDGLARRVATAAGLTVWGTLKTLLEAKSRGMTKDIRSLVARLEKAGMWISDDIRKRILALAGENK